MRHFVGDRGDLMELLGNLIDNACKWCAGQVRVSVSMDRHRRKPGSACASWWRTMVRASPPRIAHACWSAACARTSKCRATASASRWCATLSVLYGGRLAIEQSRSGRRACLTARCPAAETGRIGPHAIPRDDSLASGQLAGRKPLSSSRNTRTRAQLERVVADIARLPPMVVSWEIEALRDRLAEAQRGEAFLLQGGDCAESFADCESDHIAKQLKILLQMSLVLLHGLKRPIIRVGRMAGQYAKPRSADTETQGRRDAAELPRRSGQPPGVHRRGARARSGAAAARLRARGADAQLRARADRRRLCRPASPGVLGSGLRAIIRR